MGNIHKDDKIDIKMELDRVYYISGQEVKGCVYLQAKELRAYSALQIVINGKEYVHWAEQYDNVTIEYQMTCKSYQDSFTLLNFKGTVPQGQYSFPFSFYLPTMMCGSFRRSSQCYIQYTCSARLTHLQMKKSQIYPVHLNIIEPPRSFGPIRMIKNTHAQCCSCCMSYGDTKITMVCNKSFLTNGEYFTLEGCIDNHKGKSWIKKAKISLKQKTIMDATEKFVIQGVNKYILKEIDKHIKPKQKYDFKFQLQIPNDIFDCTAIGNITARYFFIHLSTYYGCCTQPASASLHIVLHSKEPMVMVNKKVNLPQNWNPKSYPKVVCDSMKPYIYTPNSCMPCKNMPLPGQQINLHQFEKYEDYHPSFKECDIPHMLETKGKQYKPKIKNSLPQSQRELMPDKSMM